MVNITHKNTTLRKAIATAVITVSSQETIDAIAQKKVPKGDVFEFGRASGLLGVKKTSDVIPDCHPLPVEFTSITFSMEGLQVMITVEVHTVYKTGVEVEAMHGAAVTALTLYDMLKPIDKGVEISNIKLVQKQGGKSDRVKGLNTSLQSAVLVCSDSIAKGEAIDTSGKAIIEKIKQFGLETTAYDIVPDDVSTIQEKILLRCSEGVDLLLITGGTGLSHRDITPEAVEPLLQIPIPGIMETARRYGQDRMPFAMLSRGVAGFINNTLVLTLPGSQKGVEETIDALFPQVLHVFTVRDGFRHG